MQQRNGFTPLEISRIQKVLKFRAALLTGFTLIELLVVIAIMVLLMAILLPSLQRVKRQAKAVACQSNLHQCGLAFAAFSVDSDNMFWKRDEHISPAWDWFQMGPSWGPQIIDCNELLLCPMATKVRIDDPDTAWHYGGKFSAWGCTSKRPMRVSGSYGTNFWFWEHTFPPPQDPSGHQSYWTNSFVKHASIVPVYFDCTWIHGGLTHNADVPPEYDDLPDSAWVENSVCFDRHNGYVNYLFMDWSVRKIGLKELWKLKWNREFDTAGPWTKAGGVQPSDWPEWMRRFKDY
jgi:prepilin-type N-terminal cleavage/methylation domain-containing protein/prepilin-type processing-associated H-X9-DG protein